MAFLIGVILALVVGVSATRFGWDRHRGFYPMVMIVIALLYACFALLGGSLLALAAESPFILAFVGASIFGFTKSRWFVVAALAAHGLFDLVHADWIANPGVPGWWPSFCLAYDVTAAAYLAWLLLRSKRPADAT